jgi:hypothetical protein
MKAHIEVKMDNAAFDDDWTSELVRILRDLTTHISKTSPDRMTLRDINGNDVGFFRLDGRRKRRF